MIHSFADGVFTTPECPVLFETMVKHALYMRGVILAETGMLVEKLELNS